MKTKVFLLLTISFLGCLNICQAQSKKRVNVFYIIPYNNKQIKTSYFIYRPDDIEKVTIVSKSVTPPGADSTIEVVTLSLNLKPMIEVLNIEGLFDSFHMDKNLLNMPFKIDGNAVKDSNEIFAIRNAVVTINVNEEQKILNVITNLGVAKKSKGKIDEIMIQ